MIEKTDFQFKVEALATFCPNGCSADENTNTYFCTSDPKPSQEELDAKIVELKAEHETQTYARNRKDSYDDLNQFELISNDAINGTTTHKDAVEAIKTKWPKDNSGPV